MFLSSWSVVQQLFVTFTVVVAAVQAGYQTHGLRPKGGAEQEGRAPGEPKVLQRFEQTETHMGTRFRIILYSTDAPSATRAAQSAFKRIKDLDNKFSDYKDDSELTRLSRGSAGPAQTVSDDMWEILSCSMRLSKESDGAFDISAGPVVQLFRKAKRTHKLPASSQINDAKSRVGYRSIELDAAKRTVRLTKPNMLLDLGAIAKGYACEAACDALKAEHINDALVEGGGGQCVIGAPSGKPHWSVEIERPVAESTTGSASRAKQSAAKQLSHIVVRLPDGYSIATSGNASQYVEIAGKRYSHIVDPRTGNFLTTNRQVTVIHKSGMLADALATAVCVMGPDMGIKLMDGLWDSACLVFEPQGEKFAAITSRKWKSFVVDAP